MDYRQHMINNGVENPPEITADERIHRFSTDGRKSKKTGWYIAYSNPKTIVYGDWREQDVKNIWRENGSTELTSEERHAIDKKRKAAIAKDMERKARNAGRLERFFNRLPDCVAHAYLNTKQVKGYGLKEYHSNKRHLLIIPMRNTSREVVGLQMITNNGFKRYVKGSQSKKTYLGIGTPNGVIYIAEGYATGATIHAITGHAVAIAFSTGNLLEITSHFKKLMPESTIIVASDNDRWSKVNTVSGMVDNPGVYYASKAAKLTGSDWRLPQFANLDGKPTDFNDLYVREGEVAVQLYLDKLTVNKDLTQPNIKQQDDHVQFNDFEVTEQIEEKQQPIKQQMLHEPYFRCLGFEGENFQFMPTKTNKIVSIGRGSMGSKTHLISLAPLDWWKDVFFGGEKEDWSQATNYLMRVQENHGIFDPSIIRGRGAWFDNGRSVLHIGNKLIVDGELFNIHEFKTNYIYELAPSIENNIGAVPATTEQTKSVFELFGELNFERKINGHFLAGWCFLAPICSALDWRPHIWLTGERGTGKSWIQEYLVDPLVGSGAFRTQGSTTEAGIRQTLKQDGRSVIFDESESEDQTGRRRLQSVIELARQASSSSSSGIVKGSAGGEAQVFFVRSMFMFGSINVAITQASDESRITVLSLKKHNKSVAETERFHAFDKKVSALLTDELTSSIRARAYKMIPTIRHNAKVIARAIAEHLGSQRMGDQYGALLAGALAYMTNEEVTLDEAREYVSKIDFSEAQESESVRDDERLLSIILESQVRVEVDGFNYNRTIGEFLDIARGRMDKLSSIDSNKAIERFGLKLIDDRVYISNTNNELKKLLSDTPWGGNWNRVLARIDGSIKEKTAKRFAGVISKCVSIPLDFLG